MLIRAVSNSSTTAAAGISGGSSAAAAPAGGAPHVTPATIGTGSGARPVEEADLSDVVARANQAMQSLSRRVEFAVHSESGKVVVRVVDNATQQVIRQIPSEEMMSIASKIDEWRGLLFDQQA